MEPHTASCVAACILVGEKSFVSTNVFLEFGHEGCLVNAASRDQTAVGRGSGLADSFEEFAGYEFYLMVMKWRAGCWAQTTCPLFAFMGGQAARRFTH